MTDIDPLAVATQGYLLNDSSFLTPITMATLGWIKIPGEIIVVPLPPEPRRKRVGKSTRQKTTVVPSTAEAKRRRKEEEEEKDARHFYDMTIKACFDTLNKEKVQAKDRVENIVRFKKEEPKKVARPKVSKIKTTTQEYQVEFKDIIHGHSSIKAKASPGIKILPISLLVSGSFDKK